MRSPDGITEVVGILKVLVDKGLTDDEIHNFLVTLGANIARGETFKQSLSVIRALKPAKAQKPPKADPDALRKRLEQAIAQEPHHTDGLCRTCKCLESDHRAPVNIPGVCGSYAPLEA